MADQHSRRPTTLPGASRPASGPATGRLVARGAPVERPLTEGPRNRRLATDGPPAGRLASTLPVVERARLGAGRHPHRPVPKRRVNRPVPKRRVNRTMNRAVHRVAPGGARRHGESGTVTLLALGLSVVLVGVGLAVVDVAVIVAARARAQAAADLAALAALTPASVPPRASAAAIATANGAELSGCACDVDEATVTVERIVRLPILGSTVGLPARARAVVPTMPLFPTSPGTPAAPPVGARGGSGTADVRALLANPRLELSAQARADLAAGIVDRRLVALLTDLLRRHRVAVSVFRTGHGRYVAGTTVVSKHTYGRAMDVYRVDGGLVRPGHEPSRELVAWLAGLAPPTRPSEVGSPFTEFERLDGHFSDRAHLDHVHVAVG